jgi:hypothetical protein
VLFQESVDGIVKPYDPSIQLLGAENRDGVTCYLDALLFSMFARLGSFEPILYTTFDDEPRRRLSTLIRVWVNMLRTGKLIQTDLVSQRRGGYRNITDEAAQTKHLQEALAACGWEDAGETQQQDTSEAFGFITEQLQLPLLTLKMDIYHTGKEDEDGDHKFVNERLLEVAVPPDPGEGKTILLEECLEEYFNNRIDVVRGLERSNTLTSMRSTRSTLDESLGSSSQVETPGSSWSGPNTPNRNDSDSPFLATDSPILRRAISPGGISPGTGSSIIRRRVITEEEPVDEMEEGGSGSPQETMKRKKSVMRKEVTIPAWQFFSLIRPSPIYLRTEIFTSGLSSKTYILINGIAWYTDNAPTSDAQVAAHFSSTRPVLGVCLKRYAMTANGHATRRSTFIDIPTQIALPHFISDDKIAEDGPAFGNFKLKLQSVVCHRGNSVHSGHYISLIRGTPPPEEESPTMRQVGSQESEPPNYSEDRWMRFDDLANPRVTYVDIDKAMKEEMPYLLFYQVQPLYDVSPPPMEPESEPPSYTDSAIAMTIREASPIPDVAGQQTSYFDGASDEPKSRVSMSDELDRPRRSLNLPEMSDFERRGSAAYTEVSAGSASSIKTTETISAPVTPAEEATPGRISRAASRFKGENKSRSGSQVGEARKSGMFSRLANMRSREPLNKPDLTITTYDGADSVADSKDGVGVADFEPGNVTDGEVGVGRKRSKKGKSRDKSKGPSEKKDKGKGKVKEEKIKNGDAAVPDRQCALM